MLGLAITGLGVAAFVIAAARKRPGPQLTPSHLVVGLGGEPVTLTWERLERIGADPALVHPALRYHLEHADARPELGTGVVVRRLAAGELVT